eukprot:TRINITY_DN447_c0_g1_i3.p1 TRINITY_DN447_c0_g1~~TRINITY_DN447_c0_g1_i3.p1  ORF type:complete len:162 (+),score=32.21 TRINITY_DN447_c0_g1_i3:25-510(+)
MATLQCRKDRYRGVTVNPQDLPDVDSGSFEKILQDSLREWIKEGKRGVWIGVPLDKTHFIPELVKQHFDFHHAKPGMVMMNRWLPEEEENKLPLDANTTVGVGGFVLTDDNKLLVIKERYLPKPVWKLPGGMVDHGEEFSAGVMREVLSLFSSFLSNTRIV